jgi:ATP-binding cassette subfamily B protein
MAGDLISRINNDTDKLNQFFSQALVQFASNVILMTGAAIALLLINPRLGAATLLPAALVILLTRVLSSWVRNRNRISLESLGGLSAEIQESLANFKVIVAFNRVDYFRRKFDEANATNFKASVTAGMASSLFMPIYGLAHSAAQIAVLDYGIVLIGSGHATLGVLIGSLL